MKTKLPKKDSAKASTQIVEQLANEEDSLVLHIDGNEITFSHLNKVFWPAYKRNPAVTKRDYAIYLAEIAPFILPHLRSRPVTLKRFPEGITEKSFFQKHWDKNAPPFVEKVRYFSEHNSADEDFLLCNNLATLLWLAQVADLEIHTSHCRIDANPDAEGLAKTFTGSLANIENSLLNYPDFLVLDLDPYLYSGKEKAGEEPELNKKAFEKVCDVALQVKSLLDDMRIKSFVKTSGRTGLHIYVPIFRSVDYDNLREVAKIIGEYLVEDNPNDVTMEWSVAKRTGKIFFDYNMNARGKTLAAPYSLRNSKEATVSMPIKWSELKRIFPTDFTIRNVGSRLRENGDAWLDILEQKNDLPLLLNGEL